MLLLRCHTPLFHIIMMRALMLPWCHDMLLFLFSLLLILRYIALRCRHAIFAIRHRWYAVCARATYYYWCFSFSPLSRFIFFAAMLPCRRLIYDIIFIFHYYVITARYARRHATCVCSSVFDILTLLRHAAFRLIRRYVDWFAFWWVVAILYIFAPHVDIKICARADDDIFVIIIMLYYFSYFRHCWY